MVDTGTETSRLIEVPTSEKAEEGARAAGSMTPHDSSELPWKWICCTFRVRVIGIILLLLLQIPLLGYYYSASDNYITKFTDSYKNVVLDGVFGRKPRNFSEVTTNFRTIEGVTFSPTVQIIVSKPNEDSGVASITPSTRNILVTSPTTVKNDTLSQNKSTATVANIDGDTTTSQSQTKSSTTTLPTTLSHVVLTTTTERTTSQSVALNGSILPQCPPEPPNLQGPLSISFDKPPDSFEQTQLNNPLVTKGGHSKPPHCIARHKVAFIIPYRDRVEHLQYFVEYMHPILRRQQIDYQIFIINQLGYGKFNRAKLMNIGFLEASKLYPFACFAYHDVDLVLEDDRSLYWCSDRPRHMSAGVDKFKYVLPYASIFGGVTLLSKEQMEKINGFSNFFWGWGGEDDDVYNRLATEGYKIIRYPMNIARYKMISHKREKGNEPNPKRFDLIRNTRRTYKKDGLSSIQYKVTSIEFQPTYTNITVDVIGPK